MGQSMFLSVPMEKFVQWFGLLLAGGLMPSCAVSPPSDTVAPGRMTRQIVAERVSAVVVTERGNLDRWVSRDFATSQAPGDADGGSAAPIAADGYFLTADHVLAGGDDTQGAGGGHAEMVHRLAAEKLADR